MNIFSKKLLENKMLLSMKGGSIFVLVSSQQRLQVTLSYIFILYRFGSNMDSENNSLQQERQQSSQQLSSLSIFLYRKKAYDPTIPQTKKQDLNHLLVGLKSKRGDDQQSSLQGILNFMNGGGNNLEYLIEFDFIPHLAKYISECQPHVTLKLAVYTIVEQISRISLKSFSQHIIHLVSSEMDELIGQREHMQIELDILHKVILILQQLAQSHQFSLIYLSRLHQTIVLLQSNWIDQNVRQAGYNLLLKLCRQTKNVGFVDFEEGVLFLLDQILQDHHNIDGIYYDVFNLVYAYTQNLKFIDKIRNQNAIKNFVKKFQNFNILEQKNMPSILNKFYNLVFQSISSQGKDLWSKYIEHGLLIEMAKTLEYHIWKIADAEERDNIYLMIFDMLEMMIAINSELTNSFIKNQSLVLQLSRLCCQFNVNYAYDIFALFTNLMKYGDQKLIYECYVKSSIIENIVRYLKQANESIQNMVQYLLRLEQMFKLGERVSEGNNQLIIIFNQQKPINFLEEMLRTQIEEQLEIISQIIVRYVDPIQFS